MDKKNEEKAKELKEQRKKYFKMLKKHQKNLDACNKKAHRSPWDWSFGLSYLVEYISFMKDYYDLGWNVMQSDESLKKVKNSLNKTLKAYEEWNDFVFETFDDQQRLLLAQEYYRICREEGKKPDFFEQIKYVQEHFHADETHEANKDKIKELNKQYNQKRKNFFKLLSDNIEYWWD